MRNIPANLSGFSLMVTESPEIKMRETDGGRSEAVTDRQGVQQFVVSLFAKRKLMEGQNRGKGEEIKVTLEADPGEGFIDGSYVELIDVRVSPYSFVNSEGQTISGISFRAAGLKPVG